jgi:FkbM family methyltransferase
MAEFSMKIKSGIRKALLRFDITLEKTEIYSNMLHESENFKAINRLYPYLKDLDDLGFVLANTSQSRAQLQQDLFALLVLNKKRDGYFVEFGATNGITLSNTYLLEKEYGWQGILAEPARIWSEDLIANRSCKLDFRCVSDESGRTLVFHETEIPELSVIDSYKNEDMHSNLRRKGEQYLVESVSLNDLLAAHNAPNQIDFMSIDTEGSEFDILNSFDFSKYQISIIVVEHNFSDIRIKLNSLLTKNGFTQVSNTQTLWDDWYVNSNLVDEMI